MQPNVLLDAHNLYFCAGENARQKLVDDFGWTINDAGKSSDCGTTSITPGDPGNFVTTWLVDADSTIIIPTHPDETYNYNIYWETQQIAHITGH